MATQTGVGLSKILVLCGAGYTGTVLLQDRKLSDLLGQLQTVVKGLEKNGDSSEADSDHSDAIAAQVRRLAMEVRQLASSRQITILDGNSSLMGNMTSLAVPVATLGALGYGYMWWKGISFSDLMYVTKRNMENAVSNLTKHLEHVSEALAAAKRHLTQRIENLDGKLDEQVEISKLIKNEVTDVRTDLSEIGFDLDALQKMVSGLDGKICTVERKQDIANAGVLYLCNFVDGKKKGMPEAVQEQLKPSGKSRGLLTYSEAPSLKGLKEIADSLFSENTNKSITDGTLQVG
ncbi:uncharacterized protein LOC127788811 [Diospyros lotus]|uniref:uncharacterized protein LOC127788811 n=1 Tax=Diospyros lotus TaxID=55363 RepID=UPI0022504F08|nr:uncharacterized protein LOC127788811 [Diospyros lotus]XP_052173401.1 uncharacterized protein LOC127788811 [Diospyros lotus]